MTKLRDQGQQSLLNDAAKGQGEGAPHSISDYSNTFFTYQDYYVPIDDADWEVSVSLQQKFIERNTLDMVIEVLAFNMEYNEIDTSRYPARPPTRSKQGLDARHHDDNGSQMALGS